VPAFGLCPLPHPSEGIVIHDPHHSR
jgi:hypothetical protein